MANVVKYLVQCYFGTYFMIILMMLIEIILKKYVKYWQAILHIKDFQKYNILQ